MYVIYYGCEFILSMMIFLYLMWWCYIYVIVLNNSIMVKNILLKKILVNEKLCIICFIIVWFKIDDR